MDYTNAHDTQAQALDASTSSNFCYGNAESLPTFARLMSGQGRSICASMMLSDPGYARTQLRLACTLDNQALQQLAVKMLSALPRSPAGRRPSCTSGGRSP